MQNRVITKQRTSLPASQFKGEQRVNQKQLLSQKNSVFNKFSLAFLDAPSSLRSAAPLHRLSGL